MEDRQEEGPTTPGTGGDVHCRIGSMTGERQTVETNHWPQRPTWVMSSKEEVVLTTLVGE